MWYVTGWWWWWWRVYSYNMGMQLLACALRPLHPLHFMWLCKWLVCTLYRIVVTEMETSLLERGMSWVNALAKTLPSLQCRADEMARFFYSFKITRTYLRIDIKVDLKYKRSHMSRSNYWDTLFRWVKVLLIYEITITPKVLLHVYTLSWVQTKHDIHHTKERYQWLSQLVMHFKFSYSEQGQVKFYSGLA